MRVRDWDDILADVASDSTDPDGWRAVAGSRREGLGEDLTSATRASASTT